VRHLRKHDLELNCLSNAKEVAPQSAEELHSIVTEMFKDIRSESLGWQALYEAYSGHRACGGRRSQQRGAVGSTRGACAPQEQLHGYGSVRLGLSGEWKSPNAERDHCFAVFANAAKTGLRLPSAESRPIVSSPPQTDLSMSRSRNQ